MKITLLLIPLLLLSSCTIDWNDEQKASQSIQKNPIQTGTIIFETPKSQVSTWEIIRDFGSGFSLSQTIDTIILNYHGIIVHKWDIINPTEATLESAGSFIGEITEEKTWEYYKTQWSKLNSDEKKKYLRESLANSISIREALIPWFYIIEIFAWEVTLTWIYDIKTQHIQDIGLEYFTKIQIVGNYIFVVNESPPGGIGQHLFVYDKDFTKILTQWPEDDWDYKTQDPIFHIEDIILWSGNTMSIQARTIDQLGRLNQKSEYIIRLP